MVLKNEFAIVNIICEDSKKGGRLIVQDVNSGSSISLDPLELEILTRISHKDFLKLLDASEEE